MLLYATLMPQIKSAKKALRGSMRKRQYNNLWKARIKSSIKNITRNLGTKGTDIAILNENLVVLQKVLDKASKNNVLHKNKANRLKSRYAKKISAQSQASGAKSSKKSAPKQSAKPATKRASSAAKKS